MIDPCSMAIHVDKKLLVVQSNRLIEAKYRLSVEEQKIIKILVSQIQKDDADFKDYEFRIKELAELLGMTHSNPYGVLRSITKRLVSKVLEFYDQDKQEFIQASWLSGAKYRQGLGTVVLHFDPLLKPLLLQLQSYFTKYEIGQVLQFKGQYTIRFFEFRKSFLGRHKEVVVFTLKELREVLGIKKGEYKIFRDFKNRVLEPARAELLEKTGQSFAWEAIRQGQGGKVVGVRVAFDGDRAGHRAIAPVIVSSPSPFPEPPSPAGHSEPPSPSPQEPPVAAPPPSPAVQWLEDCGVSPVVAKDLATRYECAYIQEKISAAERPCRRGQEPGRLSGQGAPRQLARCRIGGTPARRGSTSP